MNQFKATNEEVRELEKDDVLLTQQKTVTKDLYLLADSLYQPLKIFNVVVQKAALPTSLVQDIINNLKKRNIEGGLVNIKSLMQVVASNKELLTSKAMKPIFPHCLKPISKH